MVKAVVGPISTANLATGDEVPIPMRPDMPPWIIERAGVDEVAKVVADEVAKYRLPPAFLNDQ